jgi:hypothetical protein
VSYTALAVSCQTAAKPALFYAYAIGFSTATGDRLESVTRDCLPSHYLLINYCEAMNLWTEKSSVGHYYMRSSICDVTQHELVVWYRHFGRSCWSHIQWSEVQEKWRWATSQKIKGLNNTAAKTKNLIITSHNCKLSLWSWYFDG